MSPLSPPFQSQTTTLSDLILPINNNTNEYTTSVILSTLSNFTSPQYDEAWLYTLKGRQADLRRVRGKKKDVQSR
jgi:hypothetical protein